MVLLTEFGQKAFEVVDVVERERSQQVAQINIGEHKRQREFLQTQHTQLVNKNVDQRACHIRGRSIQLEKAGIIAHCQGLANGEGVGDGAFGGFFFGGERFDGGVGLGD